MFLWVIGWGTLSHRQSVRCAVVALLFWWGCLWKLATLRVVWSSIWTPSLEYDAPNTGIPLHRRGALYPRVGVCFVYTGAMIFKRVGEGRPYPDHGLTSPRDWATVAPRQIRLNELVTTKRTLDLDSLLTEDSTFYGDLFAHVVQWEGTLYLEDGLHRAVRAALQQRTVLHARVVEL